MTPCRGPKHHTGVLQRPVGHTQVSQKQYTTGERTRQQECHNREFILAQGKVDVDQAWSRLETKTRLGGKWDLSFEIPRQALQHYGEGVFVHGLTQMRHFIACTHRKIEGTSRALLPKDRSATSPCVATNANLVQTGSLV